MNIIGNIIKKKSAILAEQQNNNQLLSAPGKTIPGIDAMTLKTNI